MSLLGAVQQATNYDTNLLLNIGGGVAMAYLFHGARSTWVDDAIRFGCGYGAASAVTFLYNVATKTREAANQTVEACSAKLKRN